jgi:hypothetical protein
MVTVMEDGALLSRCGIYCGACYIYRAQRDGVEYLRKIAKQQNVEPEEVHCMGCCGPIEELWVNCRLCPVLNCQAEKGYKNCAQCQEFWNHTCESYERLAAFCNKRGEDVRSSLIRLDVDPMRWLCQQGEKWRCPSCGHLFSWYDKVCHSCGTDLGRTDLNY